MKVLLATVHLDNSPQAFPLAAAVLASNIPSFAQGEIMDLYLGQSVKTSTGKILESDPDVVGFSVYLWNIKKVLALAEELLSLQPDLRIIAGGPEVTADYRIFQKTGFFDTLFTGEGEVNLSAYLEMLKKGEDPPDLFTQTSPLNVSASISPFLAKTINPSAYDGILWELSRGCIFNCSFCFESRGIKKVRSFPLERIERELKLFTEVGVPQVFVLDPTFNLDRERAKTVLRLIKQTAPGIHFTFEIRSEFLDRETAELFSHISCSIQIGLQSADNRVLKNVSRSFDRDDFHDKILMLHEEGAVYGFDLIYGLPTDTYEGFCRSLDYALSLRPNHLDIFPLAVLKGTDLYDQAENFKLNWRKEEPYTVHSTPDFPAEAMEKARKLAEACDIFYNRGEAVPWFYMVLELLEIKPSVFLEAFAGFLHSNTPSGLLETAELQIKFIGELFAEYGRERESKAAADIIHWMSGTSHLIRNGEIDSLFMKFNFNIKQLLDTIEMGIDNLEELSFFADEGPFTVKLVKSHGEVFPLIIEP